jgi:endonuclease/exonuclease/phosphatase family metal-dependent hydrolase
MKLLSIALGLITSLGINALTIGTYNIRNFDYDQRYRITTDKTELSNILKNLNVDVLSVEEINNTAEWEKFIQTKMPGYGTELSRCGGAHGQRLGFLYNSKKVELLSFHEDLDVSNPGGPGTCDSGSRPLAVGLFRIKSTGQKFYGMTAHLKSGSKGESIATRTRQFEIIKNLINELKRNSGVHDFFLAGDLNTTEYLSKGVDFKILSKFTKDLGMIDLSAGVKCTAYYWGGTDDGIETPSMLDHVIVTPGLVKLKSAVSANALGHCQKVDCREVPIAELGVSYGAVSDHCPITARIQ